MPINKTMILHDPLGHEISVEHHEVKTIITNVRDNVTTIMIASYRTKAEKEWREESYVKPPISVVLDGIDKTVHGIETEIIALPEWEGATIVE